MCIVCGSLWTEEHWAEVSADRHSVESDGTIVLEVHVANRGQRLRDRALRSRFANLLLDRYGLQLQDWEGSSYILRDKKGNSEVVNDLASLWKVAEQMVGRPLDPLDPHFLASLKHGTRP
jgi:hypothetical protein